jgi:Helix-turn-helix domain
LEFVTMSGNELQRIEVLAEVLSGRRTEASAAAILGISTRQTRRLVVAYRANGGASVIHKSRGRASNNRLLEGIREYAVGLVRSNYSDFGPSLAAEMLLTKHD